MRFVFTILFFISLLFSTSLHDNLQEGVKYYKSKQYKRALEIFDRLVIKYPKNKRVRLEYARVLYRLGMYDESKSEFQKVLDTKPPLVVQKNIKYFIRLIEKKQKKDFFNGSISIGATRDTNIENKSDNPMYAGFVDENKNKRKDNFITAEFSLFSMKKLPNARWMNSLYIYDEQSHQKSSDRVSFVSLSSTYQLPLFGLRVSLPLSYSLTYIDSQRYSKSIRVQPKAEKLNNTSITSMQLLYDDNKNYNDDKRSYKSYGIRGKYFWMLNRFRNFVGFTIKQYKAKKDIRLDVSKKRVSVDMSSSYPITGTNFLSLFFKNTHDKYTKEDPTIQDNRKDTTNNLSFSINQEISKNNSFELSVSKIKNKSNLDFYSYEKSLFSIKLRKSF